MRKLFVLLISIFTTCQCEAQSNAPVIKEADGFVIIPKVAMPPDKKRTYRAIFDATKAAKESSEIVPAINNSGALLNDFGVSGVPLQNAKFVLVFHGAAINAILDDAHYKAKFGISNPNLPVLTKLKKAGVKIFVCGQNLLSENIDPKTISKDVTVASDALIVLISYQNDGYALMSY